MTPGVRIWRLCAFAILSVLFLACSSDQGLTICQAASMDVGDRVEVTARFKGHGGILLDEPDPDAELSADDYSPSSTFETDERCNADQADNDKLTVVAATPAAQRQFESLERGSWVTVIGTIEEFREIETHVVLVDAEIGG